METTARFVGFQALLDVDMPAAPDTGPRVAVLPMFLSIINDYGPRRTAVALPFINSRITRAVVYPDNAPDPWRLVVGYELPGQAPVELITINSDDDRLGLLYWDMAPDGNDWTIPAGALLYARLERRDIHNQVSVPLVTVSAIVEEITT